MLSDFAQAALVHPLYVRDRLAIPQLAAPADLPRLNPAVTPASGGASDAVLVREWNEHWTSLLELVAADGVDWTSWDEQVREQWPRCSEALDEHQADAARWRSDVLGFVPTADHRPAERPWWLESSTTMGRTLHTARFWFRIEDGFRLQISGLPVGGDHVWSVGKGHLLVSAPVFADPDRLAALVLDAAGLPGLAPTGEA